MFLKVSSLDRTCRSLFNGILNFSVAQIFVDFYSLCVLSDREEVWLENEKVYTQVVFNYLLILSSFFSKLFFSKTILDMELKKSG